MQLLYVPTYAQMPMGNGRRQKPIGLEVSSSSSSSMDPQTGAAR
jgi:hypothetical protein